MGKVSWITLQGQSSQRTSLICRPINIEAILQIILEDIYGNVAISLCVCEMYGSYKSLLYLLEFIRSEGERQQQKQYSEQ